MEFETKFNLLQNWKEKSTFYQFKKKSFIFSVDAAGGVPWLHVEENAKVLNLGTCASFSSKEQLDFQVQTWPDLHKIPQNMEIRQSLDPKTSKVTRGP
jgi:hypothetical protein